MLHSLDRQKKILENLSFDHVTSIHYLCRKTQFNESTIRRDIKLLEQEKKVIIVRGGVIPIKVNEITPLFIENLKEELNKFKTKKGIPFDLSLLEIHLLQK